MVAAGVAQRDSWSSGPCRDEALVGISAGDAIANWVRNALQPCLLCIAPSAASSSSSMIVSIVARIRSRIASQAETRKAAEVSRDTSAS